MILLPEKNAVIVSPREPKRLAQIIPTARLVRYNGRAAVAVPHRLEETRFLTNLGLKVPSPILSKYHWPRNTTRIPQPFEAQRKTAAMLTLNPRAFVLNDLGCVDAETEYLTPTGWRRVDQYAGGEVAQYIPETGAIEFVADPEYVKLPCERMLRVKTKYGVDQLLSPEHRVLITDRAGTKQETLQAHELFARQEQWAAGEKRQKSRRAVGYCKASIPAVYTAPGGDGLPLTDAKLRLQIAVIADGHFPNQSGTCVVRLKKPRKKARLRALLQQAGVEYRENDKTTVPGFSVFSFTAPRRDKEFTADYWHCTPAQLAVVCDEVLHWDGCMRKGKPTCEFSSNSKASADFVQYAFNAGGRVARITVDDRGPTYCVLIRDNGAPLQLAGSGIGGRKRAITPAPSTDGFKYCFMVPSTYLILRRNGCVFASGNTGKSLSALWAFDYLRSLGCAQRLLVVCPLSTTERTWGDEVFFHFPHLSSTVIYGPRKKRLKLLSEADSEVLIVNHHGVQIIADELANMPDITHVIIDELAVARNKQTDMWRSFNAVINEQTCAIGKRSAWGLTATPTPNAPTDAFAQVKLINPSKAPRSMRSFQQATMTQMGPYLWVPKKNAVDEVARIMDPSIRFSREECVDLPATIYMERHAALSPQQERAYKAMHSDLCAQVEQGQVLAVNEAVKVGKLVQIACGVVYDDQKAEHVVGAESRIKVVVEAVAESDSKTIVFVPYIAPLNYLREALTKQGIDSEVIHGGVSKPVRDKVFNRFQNTDPTLRVLVAQPSAMSHGLTLTAASTIVWYAPTTSAETYEQANGRITRPGQKHTTVIVNVEGTPIERRIYHKLRTKQSMQNLLLAEKAYRE